MFDTLFQKSITVKNIIFFVIALLFIFFIAQIKDIAILFFASYVIACSMLLFVDFLMSKFKKLTRAGAAAIVMVCILLLILAFFVPLLVLTGYEIKSFIDHMPNYFDSLKVFINTTPWVNNIGLSDLDFSDFMSSVTGVTSTFVNQSIIISKNFTAGFVYFLMAMLIIYYFIADKEIIKTTYLRLFPENMKAKAGSIIDAISNKIGGYVVAQIVTMSSVGVVMIVGLLLSGVEYALVLGLLTAILDIVPVVGPAIALGICLITTYKSGLLTIGLVCLVFVIAQLVENNFVRPYIFGKMLNIHPLIIYLFLLITAQYLGVIGVVFAPAIAATICVLVEELYIKNINN